MKKLLSFLVVFLLLGSLQAQNPSDADTSEKIIGYKVVGNKVWFMKENIVESVVCVPGKPGCFVATTTLKPVDVYTAKGPIPNAVLERMSWKDGGGTWSGPGIGKAAGSYTDKYLVHYSEYDKTLYSKDAKNKTIYASGTKPVGYYDLRLMILVCCLFGIYSISFLSDKSFDNKSWTLTAILAVLWIISGIVCGSFMTSVIFPDGNPEYKVEGLRIWFLVFIFISSAITNWMYSENKKLIPSSIVFTQIICLILYIASIPVTDTPLSIIIPIFVVLLSIKFFKSLFTMFKPTIA